MPDTNNQKPQATTTTTDNNSLRAWVDRGKKTAQPAKEETYRPSRGSWGYFERPKDISKAYSAGQRVGVEHHEEQQRSDADRTKMLLKRYRVWRLSQNGTTRPRLRKPWDRFVGHAVWHVQHRCCRCVGSRQADEMVLEREQGVVGAYEANGRTSKSTANSGRETQIDSWHQASRPAG